MAEIIKYEWDFGNGGTSNKSSPYSSYYPGVYTVQCRAILDDGSAVRAIEEKFIIVGESNTTTLDKDIYVDTENKASLHFGFEDSHGYGWSVNTGNDFVWAESQAAITQYEENGIIYELVWDMFDDMQYIINTRDSFYLTAAYRDKMTPLTDKNTGEIINSDDYKNIGGGSAIEAAIKLPELQAETPDHEMHHEETTVQFRPETGYDDLTGEFSVDFTLITDKGLDHVEVERHVDIEKEILFYYQNNRVGSDKTNQLMVETNTSRFQLLGYQSLFKRVDNFDRATTDHNIDDGSNQASMEILGAPSLWYTRGGYSKNKGSYRWRGMVGDRIPGPDGLGYSAIELTSGFEFPPETVGQYIYWTIGVDGEWALVNIVDDFSGNIIPEGTKLFDFRVFYDKLVPDSVVELYHDKFKEYLPRA